MRISKILQLVAPIKILFPSKFLTFSPRFAIATETAPDKAKETMPGPEILGKAFVLAAEAPMDLSGQCLAFEEGKLVKEVPMVG